MVTFTGTSGALIHSAAVAVTVTAPLPDYTLAVSPASATIVGGAAGATVNVTATSAINVTAPSENETFEILKQMTGYSGTVHYGPERAGDSQRSDMGLAWVAGFGAALICLRDEVAATDVDAYRQARELTEPEVRP